MQLHTLKRKHINWDRTTRVGRGGKRGTMSGGGQKGQKSRSGHRIRPAIRDLIQRLPKLRGYRNKAKSDPVAVVTLSTLNRLSGTVVSRQTLIDAGVAEKGQAIKILATGRLTRAITIEGLKISAGAKQKIEKAGGSIK